MTKGSVWVVPKTALSMRDFTFLALESDVLWVESDSEQREKLMAQTEVVLKAGKEFNKPALVKLGREAQENDCAWVVVQGPYDEYGEDDA